MNNTLCFLICSLNLLLCNAGVRADDSTEFNTIDWDAGYICDASRNFSGGLKSGNAFMGLIYGGIILHSDKIWEGGTLSLFVMNTHGKNLSENYIGDIQVASNIENGNYTFIEELFFRQDFSKFSLLMGLQDLNAEFCVSEYGGTLTNSSFGIHSTFALNFSTPLYPKTALAIAALYTLNDNITMRASIWDGDAGSLEDDPHNLGWSISSEEGFLTVEEFEYRSSSENLTDIKVGGFYHTGEFIDSDDTSTIKGNIGLYAICDKQLFKNGSHIVGAFGQLAIFPTHANINTLYMGGGLTISGIMEKRPDDCFSAGFAYAGLFDDTYECDIECNYCCALGNHITYYTACSALYISPRGRSGNK